MLCVAGSGWRASAEEPSPSESEILRWTVDGQRREAIVFLPSKANAQVDSQANSQVSAEADSVHPVVFVFHGHGGTAKRMSQLGFSTLWPEAIVVCPQGLPTPTGRDPKGERSGWQTKSSRTSRGAVANGGNRDLKFFDVMLHSILQDHRGDPKQVFVTGHSNGGGFTYCLLAHRADKLRAIAPSAAGAGALRNLRPGSARQSGSDKASAKVTPIPVLHVAGKSDAIVAYKNQERTIRALCTYWGLEPTPSPIQASKTLQGKEFTAKPGLTETPDTSQDVAVTSSNGRVVFVTHPGGHRYHRETPEAVVRFFKSSGK